MHSLPVLIAWAASSAPHSTHRSPACWHILLLSPPVLQAGLLTAVPMWDINLSWWCLKMHSSAPPALPGH